MARLNNILLAGAAPIATPGCSHFDRILGQKLRGGELVIREATPGPIATFTTNIAKELASLIVNITPVQSGTGDPSPDNVRPISGWTGGNVSRTGVNIYNRADKASEDTYFLDSSGNPVANKAYYTSNFIKVKPYTYYYYAINGVPAKSETLHNAPRIAYYTEQKEYISSSAIIGRGISFRTPLNCAYIKVPMYRINAEYWTAMLTEGTAAPVTYSAFGTTYPITFPSEAGTVYGGMLDVVSGLLRVDRYFDDLSALSWEVKYTGSSNKTLLSNVSSGYKTTATSSDFILENYVARSGVAGTASLSNPDGKNIGFYWYGNSVIETARYLYLVIDINSNPTGKIVYKLATPLTYQLTPTQINTLLGTNNIWADTGDIAECKYYYEK